MGVLFNPHEEKFAQLIAQGMKPAEAKDQCGLPKSRRHGPLMKMPRIKERIDELLVSSARRAELTRAKIIEEIREEARLARANQQHSAALKGYEMLGKELHKMFIDRKEIGGPGDFEDKTEEELKAFIMQQLKELGFTDLKDLGLEGKDLAALTVPVDTKPN